MGLIFQPFSASGGSIYFCRSMSFLSRKAICPGFTSELRAASVASMSLTGQSLPIGLAEATEDGTGRAPAGAGGLGGLRGAIDKNGIVTLHGIMAVSPLLGVVCWGINAKSPCCNKAAWALDWSQYLGILMQNSLETRLNSFSRRKEGKK